MIKFLAFFIVTTGSWCVCADYSTIALLTNNSQKSWVISSISSGSACSSSSDDSWIFFANGTFEYNHGTVTEDATNECSDFVNYVGTWEFTNNEAGLRIKALHEKGNASNAIEMTIMDATIVVLDESQLKVTQADPSGGGSVTIQFNKR
jgi:hypothetical protein